MAHARSKRDGINVGAVECPAGQLLEKRVGERSPARSFHSKMVVVIAKVGASRDEEVKKNSSRPVGWSGAPPSCLVMFLKRNTD